jgi:hypothetical protein
MRYDVHQTDAERHGIGTVTEMAADRYYVAWSMPGSTSMARWEHETAIRPATPEDIERARS